MIKKILVPFDLSSGSIHALKVAEEIAQPTLAAITLLHVTDNVAAPADHETALMQKNALHRLLMDCKFDPAKFDIVVQNGVYTQKLIELHRRSAFDLIVLGECYHAAAPTPASNIDLPEILGSCKVPVLSVNPEAQDLDRKKLTILVQKAMDPYSTLPAAMALARIFSARISLLGLTSFSSTRAINRLERKIGYCQESLSAGGAEFIIHRMHVAGPDEKKLNYEAWRKRSLVLLSPQLSGYTAWHYVSRCFRQWFAIGAKPGLVQQN